MSKIVGTVGGYEVARSRFDGTELVVVRWTRGGPPHSEVELESPGQAVDVAHLILRAAGAQTCEGVKHLVAHERAHFDRALSVVRLVLKIDQEEGLMHPSQASMDALIASAKAAS